jgi:LysM repeat protein
VSRVYKQYGVNLPRSSRDTLGEGTPVERAEPRPGDLVFFNYGYSHVGVHAGDNKYIHSPSSGKLVQESNLNGRGRSDHYVAARRIIDNAGGANISERLKTEWIQASRHQTALALNDRTAQKRAGANAAYQAPTPKKSRTAAKKKGATTTVAAKKSAGTRKVASGDALVDVARRYGVSASDIVAFNRLPNANKIKPGQTLQIRAPNKKAAVSPKKKASVASKKKSAAREAPAKRAKAPTTRKKS